MVRSKALRQFSVFFLEKVFWEVDKDLGLA